MLYGSASGLSAAGSQAYNQDSAGIADAAETGDGLGKALAAADLDGDGDDDLTAGGPGESVGAATAAGAVNVIYGSGGGLTSAGNQVFNQDSAGMADASEAGDSLGSALAAGDLNGDSRDDLAVGAPAETIGATSAGAVSVIYGSGAGLSSAGNQVWQQNSAGISEAAESGDSFGAALTAGDLNADSRDDLAVGVPSETIGTTNAGAVNVIYGSGAGLAPRATSSGARTAPMSRTLPRPVTGSARRWRRATSTATAMTIWQRERPGRVSAPPRPPAA